MDSQITKSPHHGRQRRYSKPIHNPFVEDFEMMIFKTGITNRKIT